MKIRMLEPITGTRNGERWPPVGGTVDLPDDEADQLIRQGRAETLPKTRKATKTPRGEKR